MLRKTYDWVLSLAESKHSHAALFGISAIESIFFPIPPDTLLMPLCLGDQKKAFRFAFICTLGSLVGAVAGYFIGYQLWWAGAETYSALAQWFFDHVPSFSEKKFLGVRDLYEKYNFWIIFGAAFTPIPYKVITVTAGAFHVNFLMFCIASFVGRALRFFLIAGLIAKWGEWMRDFIDKYFGWLAIAFFILLIGGFYVLKVVLH